MRQLTAQLSLMIIGLLIIWFVKNEIIVFFALILLVIGTFWIDYDTNEYILIILGAASGFILEIIGDYFNELQYWNQGMFFGIPLWLPLLWGYGFVIIRRIGNKIVKN